MSTVPGLTMATLHRARLSRDARFDGRFFIGVLSTGIYCRPICPSPRCKRANVVFYATAAAAQADGFRPCRRCRPEVAPGCPAWLGPSAVVRRALRLIQDGTLDDGSVEELATRVGVGARHLSRLFFMHVGVSPSAVALTRRLHLAKQLLDETSLSVTHVAMASGFRSVRRFNEAFRAAFKCSPRESRKRRRLGFVLTGTDEVLLTLPFRPPYAWDSLAAFLRARALPGVECVSAHSYARTVRLGHGEALIDVTPIAGAHALRLKVARAPACSLFEMVTAARRMFDVSADPAQIASALGTDALLAQAVAARPGLRIPGTWEPFECLVRAALGESLERPARPGTLEALLERCGEALAEPFGSLQSLFPSPARVLQASLRGLGLDDARIVAVRALAEAVLERRLDLTAPSEILVQALSTQFGFDSGATQYVLLRGLGEPDAWPLSAERLRGLTRSGAAANLEERAEAWRPWRGYGALYLALSGRPPRAARPRRTRSNTAATAEARSVRIARAASRNPPA
jgi:AraC family transcriptional regulator, regulatory protein of adaptative response / DNA-3-methyladenine glycosylase II